MDEKKHLTKIFGYGINIYMYKPNRECWVATRISREQRREIEKICKSLKFNLSDFTRHCLLKELREMKEERRKLEK